MAASPTGTHPEDMGECVSGTKADRNESTYYVKEAAFPDNSPPDDMVVVVGYEKNKRMIDLMMKKRQHAHMTLFLMIWR